MSKPASGKIPPQALQNITLRHRQIMYRLIAGELQVNISADLNIGVARLSVICNSPMFKKELRKLENDVYENMVATRGTIADRVTRLQPSALTVIETMMKSKKTPMRTKRDCAKDILELGQRQQRKNEDDGLNPYSRVIQEAFKIAESKQSNSLIRDDDKVIEVDSMDVSSETGLPIDPLEVEPAEPEGSKEISSISESVQDVLGEMGIMDPVELKKAI